MKAKPMKANEAPHLGRLSQSFLEEQARIDAEYRARIEARQAEDDALKAAVFAQNRRAYTDRQERVLKTAGARDADGFRRYPKGGNA